MGENLFAQKKNSVIRLSPNNIHLNPLEEKSQISTYSTGEIHKNWEHKRKTVFFFVHTIKQNFKLTPKMFAWI